MRWQNKTDKQSPYATGEDFGRIFSENHDELCQLAFLLSADPDKAGQAVVTGIQESVTSNHVFREWAHSWAKRAVIKNAISLIQPQPPESDQIAMPIVNEKQHHLEFGHFDVASVLELKPFQRFVFVMSALERYSDAECALLLHCSTREIQNALVYAWNAILTSTHEHAEKAEVRKRLNGALDGVSGERRSMPMSLIAT